MDVNNVNIKFLKAFWGDCFLIIFNNEKKTTFLIDGGIRRAFRENIEKNLEYEYSRNLSNFIFLTHIDEDHIGGIQVFFERYLELVKHINGVFFNTFESLSKIAPNVEDTPCIYVNDDNSGFTSYKQGKKLEEKLEELGINIISDIVSRRTIYLDGILITFLSPSIESFSKYKTWAEEQEKANTASKTNDYKDLIEILKDRPFFEEHSPTNASSLSMLIEYEDIKMLFLGDSLPSDIVSTLNSLGYSKENKLKLDVVKISHHGSKHNTSNELLEMLICGKYLISTDGRKFGHPDKEALARIIYSQDCPELIFNYSVYKDIFTDEELQSGLFSVNILKEVIL